MSSTEISRRCLSVPTSSFFRRGVVPRPPLVSEKLVSGNLLKRGRVTPSIIAHSIIHGIVERAILFGHFLFLFFG